VISLQSIVRLGWGYARVLARKLTIERSQLPQFLAQYARDGIVPFEATDPKTLEGASRCIACARCDMHGLATGTFNALGPGGPMSFVLGVTRHSGEHDAAELSDRATDQLLDTWTQLCPSAVPFTQLVALVRRRKEALGRVRRALQGSPHPTLERGKLP
jgi:hypothetical protein